MSVDAFELLTGPTAECVPPTLENRILRAESSQRYSLWSRVGKPVSPYLLNLLLDYRLIKILRVTAEHERHQIK